MIVPPLSSAAVLTRVRNGAEPSASGRASVGGPRCAGWAMGRSEASGWDCGVRPGRRRQAGLGTLTP